VGILHLGWTWMLGVLDIMARKVAGILVIKYIVWWEFGFIISIFLEHLRRCLLRTTVTAALTYVLGT